MWEDSQTEGGRKKNPEVWVSSGSSSLLLPPQLNFRGSASSSDLHKRHTFKNTFRHSAWMGLNHSEEFVFQEDKPRRCRGERGETERSWGAAAWLGEVSPLAQVSRRFLKLLCAHVCLFLPLHAPPPTCEGWFWMGELSLFFVVVVFF